MVLGLYSLLACLEKSLHFAADLKAYSQLLRLKISALIEAMQTRKEDNVIILENLPSGLHQSALSIFIRSSGEWALFIH